MHLPASESVISPRDCHPAWLAPRDPGYPRACGAEPDCMRSASARPRLREMLSPPRDLYLAARSRAGLADTTRDPGYPPLALRSMIACARPRLHEAPPPPESSVSPRDHEPAWLHHESAGLAPRAATSTHELASMSPAGCTRPDVLQCPPLPEAVISLCDGPLTRAQPDSPTARARLLAWQIYVCRRSPRPAQCVCRRRE